MEDEDLQEQQQNNQQYWLVGINTCGREVYMIMPGNYSSTKVESEKKKNISMYFQNLFLWGGEPFFVVDFGVDWSVADLLVKICWDCVNIVKNLFYCSEFIAYVSWIRYKVS